jgi:hypothetical protein
MKNINTYAYAPFSLGLRQCIGQQVSFMVMKVALWAIYSKYRLRLKLNNNFSVSQAVLITPLNLEMTRHNLSGSELAKLVAPPTSDPAIRKFLHSQKSTKNIKFRTINKAPKKSNVNLVFVSLNDSFLKLKNCINLPLVD